MPALSMRIEQVIIDQMGELIGVLSVIEGDIQLLTECSEQAELIDTRIKDQRNVDVLGNIGENVSTRHGLADPHFTRELDKTIFLIERIDQMGDGLLMTIAQK